MKQGQTTQPKNTGDLLLHNVLRSTICCEWTVAEGTTARAILQINPEEAVLTQLVLQNGLWRPSSKIAPWTDVSYATLLQSIIGSKVGNFKRAQW